MFGGPFTIPVPDIDRTDFLLCLGANPCASNGSLATAPDWPGRIEAIIERGGEVVVVDPRRSRTAEAATQWVADPARHRRLPAGRHRQVLVRRGARRPRHRRRPRRRLDELPPALAGVHAGGGRRRSPGSTRPTIRDLARRLAAAPTAAVYGRIGTTTQAFGTVASWLVDVLNVVTGNLDRPGGAMFTKAAAGAGQHPRHAGHRPRACAIHRRHSRVRGLPETLGELPVAALAEEIDTPGRRPGPGAGDDRRQPGAVDAERRPPRRRPGRRSSSWCRSTSTSTRRPATPT